MQNFNLNMNSLNKLSNPMQQIMELNQKTLRKLSYLEPGELTQIGDPKTLLEKNMQIFIDNGHASLQYMHQLFNILQDSWTDVSNEAQEKTKEMVQRTHSATTSAINKMSDTKSNTSPRKHSSHSSRKSPSHSTSSKQRSSQDESPKNKMRASSYSDKKESAHKAEVGN